MNIYVQGAQEQALIMHYKPYQKSLQMKLNHLSFTILLTLFVISLQTIHLEGFKHKSKSELLRDPLIQVTSSSADYNYYLNKEMFAIRVEERGKIYAYNKINHLYQRVITVLRKTKIIIDQDFFPKSKIKTTYLPRRRRWLFTLTFVIGGNLMELSKAYKSLSKLGVHKLKNYSQARFSSQNIKILDAYNYARESLRRALQAYSNLEIKQVESLQIIGLKSQFERTYVPTSQEVPRGDEQTSSGQGAYLAEVKGQQAEEKQIKMKVVFRIGQADSEESTYSSDEGESQSSDDSSQGQEQKEE